MTTKLPAAGARSVAIARQSWRRDEYLARQASAAATEAADLKV